MADPFAVQSNVRGPWRAYLDRLVEHRPALHAYCRKLTGNVWDGEDLMQDTLARVFTLLGKTDAQLDNPRAYLIRTATNLWIDRFRRGAREQAALALERAEPGPSPEPAHGATAPRDAAATLFSALYPKERAAIVMKDVLDLSLEETAAMLSTSVGAVKSALSRGRDRLQNRKPAAGLDAPAAELVEQFMRALADRDLETMRELCDPNLSGELVGGVEMQGFLKTRPFFEHAHMEMPKLGFGLSPRWETADYEGECVILGFRTLDGVEGLNEIHRLEVLDGRVVRLRTYCFTPETLAVVAADLGLRALPRPHRSPSAKDFVLAMVGLKQRSRAAQ